MSTSFINKINGIISATQGSNETTPTCQETIKHYTFYQLTLIPAVVITLVFAVTKPRRNMWLNFLRGRPGLIFPMDSLTRSSRISYACSFGTVAYLVYKIVLYQTYAIEYDGHRAVKSFIAIGSMFIYGMVFFPLFSSLAIGSVFSYGLGALYVWMLTGVEIFRLTECDATARARALLILRGLPSLLCMVYLSLSLPVRMVTAFRQGRYFYWDDDFLETNTLEDIRESYSGHHVVKLFQKPEVKPPREGLKARIINILMGLVHRFLYQRKRGFRYPSRIISVMFIAVLVVYTMSFEIFTLIPETLELYSDGLLYYMDITIGLDEVANETENIIGLRHALYTGCYFLYVGKICVIVSNVLATVIALLNVLHSLSSYRANMYALYRGDHSHIPPAAYKSNTAHCINSIKYGGFQVGYIIWGFLLQFIILTLISLVLAVIYMLIKYEFTSWLMYIVELLWPIILTAVLVAVAQKLLAKFVFLQNRGKYLALDNRNLYFNFTYFMFFYNIFLGLVSCLLRILKAMSVGIVFLSRLDNSTLPRRFEFIDPGFQAYVGCLHVEAAHTHPVAVVFTRLMYLGLQKKKERMQARESKPTSNGSTNLEMSDKSMKYAFNGIKIEMNGTSGHDNISEEQRRRSVAARFNWHVMYTLLHNPEIRVMRKGFVQMLRQACLLGVHITISDQQADINFEQLHQSIADAKVKYNPTKKNDDCVPEKDGDDVVDGVKQMVDNDVELGERNSNTSTSPKKDESLIRKSGKLDSTSIDHNKSHTDDRREENTAEIQKEDQLSSASHTEEKASRDVDSAESGNLRTTPKHITTINLRW